ncbi:peptidylprolyl isomerase [Bdellovibrionota bacterium]
MSKVTSGGTVKIHYTAKFEDGNVFDTSEGKDPFQFEVGSEDVIKGVSDAVIDMAVGEKKTVTISPEEAYGKHHAELVYEVDLTRLPENVKVGDQLKVNVGERDLFFWVAEVGDEKAKLDGNHPLAGKSLVFEIEIIAID